MYSLFTVARFAALISTSISGTSVSSALLSTATMLPELLQVAASDHTASRVSGGEHWRSQRRMGCRSASRPSHAPRHGLHVLPTHPLIAHLCPPDLHCLDAQVHDLLPLAILESVACRHHVQGH